MSTQQTNAMQACGNEQVTRLKCGGFVFGRRICHCLVDAPGAMQFEKAVCEFARGRETFMARRSSSYSYRFCPENNGIITIITLLRVV